MKKAFSLVEIGLVIFVLMAVFFTVIPFSVSNVKQAKFITDWKNYMAQAEYSFETLQEYKKISDLSFEEAVAKYMHYMDAKKILHEDREIKRYKYKMLNGKFYQKMNISNFDEIYKDVKGRIIGVKYGEICDKTNPCMVLWVDMNGPKKPNTVGKDIFIYEIYKDSVQPYGNGLIYEALKKDCSKHGTGAFCSKFYMIGGD